MELAASNSAGSVWLSMTLTIGGSFFANLCSAALRTRSGSPR
jgi:hypothetical protein